VPDGRQRPAEARLGRDIGARQGGTAAGLRRGDGGQ